MARWRWTALLSRAQDAVVGKLPRGIVLEPWESFISISGLVNGIVLMFVKPRLLSLFLPQQIVQVWSTTLLISCALILYGVVRMRRLPERMGLQLLASACVAYALTIVVAAGWYGTVAFIPYLSFALASIVRLWLLKKGYQRVIVRQLGGEEGAG
jgi:hypothetical protein